MSLGASNCLRLTGDAAKDLSQHSYGNVITIILVIVIVFDHKYQSEGMQRGICIQYVIVSAQGLASSSVVVAVGIITTWNK